MRFRGVTGHVEFDEQGFRRNYDLDVFNVGLQTGPEKVHSCIHKYISNSRISQQ